MSLLLVPTAVQAQTPGGVRPKYETRYTRWPEMRVPFEPITSGGIRQVQLFVMREPRREWQQVGAAGPADGGFPPYVASEDGIYWFGVRAMDFQGSAYPPSLADITPQLKIILDRQPPVVSLRQIPDRRPGVVTVEWDVRDENLDLGRFALEFRVPGHDWRREPSAVPQETGMQSWQIEAGSRMEVRLRVADRAGNEEVASTTVGLMADGRPIDPPPSSGGSTRPTSGQREAHYVNSLQVSLSYRIAARPLSGMPVFELWYTKNEGRTWSKAPQADGSQTPGTLPPNPGALASEALTGKLVFNADNQGLYGFLIVARNGVGIGDPDPKPNDPPTHWVVVDTEKPKLKLQVQRGQGYDVRHVRIEWSADDPNLPDRPVTIEYAEVKDKSTPPDESDWKPIEGYEGPFDKVGSFTWTVSPRGPFCFHVRAKATDKAGNTSIDQTSEPVLVDLEPPKVIIDSIGVGGSSGK